MPPSDAIISALPDWSGRLWFVSRNGRRGSVDPATGTITRSTPEEPIGNSFAIDETGGVYIVTDAAHVPLRGGGGRRAAVAWRAAYDNIGVQKPGQTQAGSGTTPTLMGRGLVAITDNADPMNVVVFRRDRTVSGPAWSASCRSSSRARSTRPVADRGRPLDRRREQLRLHRPGRDRAAARRRRPGSSASTSSRRATAAGSCGIERGRAVGGAEALAGAGLVYTYTKPADADGNDFWIPGRGRELPGGVPRRPLSLLRSPAGLHLGRAATGLGMGPPQRGKVVLFAAGAMRPMDIEVLPGGDLLYVDQEHYQVQRISYTAPSNTAPTASRPRIPVSGAAPLNVAFDATGSSDPDTDAFTYEWDLDGGWPARRLDRCQAELRLHHSREPEP